MCSCCRTPQPARLREILFMYKHIAILAAVLVLGLCAGASLAAERAMPGATLGGSVAAEIDAPTHEDAITGAGIRGGSDALRLQPDSTSETHADPGAHANLGADNGSAELSPKARSHGRWQSLLPGVMK
jgi:hypothetical protein